MTSDVPTKEFTDITDEVDELLARPDGSYATNLAAVRKAFNLTQVELARTMGVSQAAITKLEHQDDMLLSTFSSYMRALHGRVRLVVDFGGGQEVEVALQPAPRRASA